MLSMIDYKKFYDIIAHATYNINDDNTYNINPLLQQWQTNKMQLYKTFGKKLTLSYPVKTPISIEQYDYIRCILLNQANRYEKIIKHIDNHSLCINKLIKDTTIDNKHFPAGKKLSRVFRELLSDSDFIVFDKIYFKALNSLFVEGNLCFSINPIDFLTMATSWNTCHDLNGLYRAGTLSLMIDNCTIVCYLQETKKPYKNLYDGAVKNIPTKKWRQLIHIHPNHNVVYFNTAYPYEHSYLEEQINYYLRKILNNVNLLPKIMNTNKTNILDVMQDCYDKDEDCNYLHFNDLLVLSQNFHEDEKINHNKNYIYETEEVKVLIDDSKLLDTITVGDFPMCPVCGRHKIMTHRALECELCYPLETCCTCAEDFHKDELHNIDNELYCDVCYDNVFTYCDECDELIPRLGLYNAPHQCIR